MAASNAGNADELDVQAPAPTPKVRRHPVTQPSGHVDHQLVLVVSDPDEDGAVIGFPLGYEHQAARFLPHQFAD